jgi:hypothetical protein
VVWDSDREVIRLAATLADADVYKGTPELLSRRGTQKALIDARCPSSESRLNRFQGHVRQQGVSD